MRSVFNFCLFGISTHWEFSWTISSICYEGLSIGNAEVLISLVFKNRMQIMKNVKCSVSSLDMPEMQEENLCH